MSCLTLTDCSHPGCCQIHPIPSPSLKLQLYIAASSPVERVRIVTGLKDVTVTAGEDAELVCELSHEDVSEAAWWLGSSPLQKNEMNQMTCQGRQHRLVLTMTTPEETGTVVFVVGEERTSARLLVVPRPKGGGGNGGLMCVFKSATVFKHISISKVTFHFNL